MAAATAKVHISLVDGVLQIEGSEDFVSEQIARLEPHIVRAFENRDTAAVKPIKSSEGVAVANKVANGLDDYDHLFAENGGKIQILKTIPGANNAQKTINASLLLAYANTLVGTEVTSSDIVRETCKSHACLDSGNFAKTLKGEKEYFLLEANGKSKNIRLTVPGRKKAEELAKQLNAS